MLRRKGRVLVVGSRGRVEVDPRQTMGKESDVRGVALFGASPAEFAEMREALGVLFARGVLRPIVGPAFPLSDAAAAHEAVLHPPNGAHGKITLHP